MSRKAIDPSSKNSHRSRRLSVEALENRMCMSTTAILSGTTLNIVGDDSANNVTVVFRDNINDIQVQADGQDQHFSSLQVKNINITLKGGDDQLIMQLGEFGDPSAALFDAKNISVNLGAGNDSAQIWFGGLAMPNRVISTNLKITVNGAAGDDDITGNFGEMQHGTLTFKVLGGVGDDEAFAGLWGNIDTGATVSFNLQGQDGNDTLNTFETYNTGYDSVNIGAGGLLDINVNGGAGNDQIDVTYGGTVLGKLRIRQDGGDGNDQVKGDMHIQDGSTGAVDAVYSGSAGRDVLRMEMYGQARVSRALIDGGSGFDFASSVGIVTIVNANEFRQIVGGPVNGGVFAQ
jgi:hypothetical protein